MTTIKYDLEDVESGGGEQAQPGVYGVKIAEVTDRRPEHNDLEVVVDFYQNEGIARSWSYLNFGDSSRWKFREFTDALGLKPKGQLNLDKLVGKKVNVKISADQYQGEYRGRVNRWLKPGASDEDETETDTEPDVEPDADTEPDDGEGASGNAEDYSDWTKQDLLDEIETRNLELPAGRKTEEKLITVLEEDDAAGGSGDDDEGGGDEGPTDDYDEWPVKELKDEAEERGLELPEMASGRGAAAKNKEALIALMREDDAEPFDSKS